MRRRRDRELDEEIQAHLAMAAHDRIERGQAPDEAEAGALREFGNRTLIQELTREVWGWSSLERLWQDVRYALRGMRHSPAFTAVAVLSLALGIGANTAIFSLIHTLMLRLLPIQQPHRLVEFLHQFPGDPFLNGFSRRSYEYFRDHNHVFSDLTADRPTSFHVRVESLEPEMADGERVTGNFFPALGVRPAIGRLIGPEESAVAVVSWSWWKRRFNMDPGILGGRIIVDGAPVTVIGVLPRDFTGLQLGFHPDIWLPLPPSHSDQGAVRVVARLKPGVSIEQARAEMAILFRWTVEASVKETASESRRALERQTKFDVEPAGAGVSTTLRERFAKPLLALMAVAALTLLIACTNVAGMLLARGAARQREMALRVCLGAGRLRLVRQVLTESLLLAAAGAALGLVLAYFGTSALVGIMTSGRFIGPPPQIEIHAVPDMQVLLFTAGIALLTTVLFGLAPAWNAFAAAPASSLRGAAAGGETRFRRAFGRSLVVAQVALSVGLLSAAGLFIGNLAALERMDLGFRRDHVLLVTLDPARSGLKDEPLSRAYRDLLTRMEQIPGVRSATISGPGPLSGAGASRFATVEGHAERAEDRRYTSLWWVAPKYFDTLGVPLLAGRDFSLEDRGRPRVALINEAMARHYFGGSNPVGRHVTFEGDADAYEIVGVVGDAKYYEMREPALRTVYLNTFQFRRPESGFALRTSIDPHAVAPAVRRTVREALKDVPLVRVTTLRDQVNATIVPERLIAVLSGFFGALGSLLAAIGMYGLLAYTVARRVNEIGIRMALGATQTAISRMVLVEALGMTSAGLLIGAPLAYWGKRVAASLIPDLPLKSAFPVAFGVVTIVAVALVAAYLPARRAARVDPMDALRHE